MPGKCPFFGIGINKVQWWTCAGANTARSRRRQQCFCYGVDDGVAVTEVRESLLLNHGQRQECVLHGRLLAAVLLEVDR